MNVIFFFEISFMTRNKLIFARFARDRKAIMEARIRLRRVTGNFYINDKSTAAIVGQQPFGGGLKSGTNDKAGSIMNLYRWTSARTVKESLEMPLGTWSYPSLNL